MRILVLADEEEKGLWDYYLPEKTKGIDLIVSCGDLDSEYLEFLVTMTNKPLLYVHGNHDESYRIRKPAGAIDIEDRIYDFRGIRFLGLGGSMRYGQGSFMYTERQMLKRVRKLNLPLSITRGFDILVTHSPARGYGDRSDHAHQGFECFNSLLMQYKPAYMLHGHVHQRYGNFTRQTVHESGTVIVNGCGHTIIEIDEQQTDGKRQQQLLYRWYQKHINKDTEPLI